MSATATVYAAQSVLAPTESLNGPQRSSTHVPRPTAAIAPLGWSASPAVMWWTLSRLLTGERLVPPLSMKLFDNLPAERWSLSPRLPSLTPSQGFVAAIQVDSRGMPDENYVHSMASLATSNPRATGHYLALVLSSDHGSIPSSPRAVFRILAGELVDNDARTVSRLQSRGCVCSFPHRQ